jgi:peroxiredoxin Q/BCP
MKIRVRSLVIILLFTITVSAKAQNPSDFKLSSVTDTSMFVLSKAKGKYVVLHFLLKTECPYCMRHTHEYFTKAETLPEVVQVFIKPDTEEEIKQWFSKLPSEDHQKFQIYRDPEAKLAKQFNIPDGYEFHNQVVHYPATTILGPNGKEVFRYIGKSNADRFSFDQLVLKIEELKKAK